MKIAHCADIHIRALSRHDEYRDTFERFIRSCKDNGVDHIFVGGDIFHTKTIGISPEYIELLAWWLNAMSEVAHVHMILGNHDGNLVNASRQDAVSPIVDAISNPRVHLYKQSGTYQIEPGTNLCVFSLFDKDGWSNVEAFDEDINIACYHGPVLGSTTEADWAVDSGLTIDFFNGYDFTFLGDIHRMQHLAYRDSKPTISYPGTLVQQNYAESLEHGYLLWNIVTRNDWSVQYVPIENRRPYVTLDWDGTADSAFSQAKQYPIGTRFRIRSSVHLSQQDCHTLSSTLKNEFGASEVTYKIEENTRKSIIAAGNQLLESTDLRDVNVMMSLLKEFHRGKQVSESDWDVIADRVKSYLSSVASDGVIRNAKWSLKNLRFDNLFSYGEHNEIDFESLSGIVGIFGSNRVGKSSIVGSIMYSLFNTTDRGPVKNLHVCNIRKSHCFSRAVVGVNNTDYVIERKTTKSERRGVLNAATALGVYQVVDDDAIDLAGEQRTNTEKVIRGLIGNADDFLMTSLSAQGEINQFIEQGSTKRRHLLSRFLDLDIFDRMYDFSNKDLNSYKSQLKVYGDKDYVSLVKNAEFQLEELNNKMAQKTAESAEVSNELSHLRHEITNHKHITPITQSQVEAQKNQLALLTTQFEKNCNEIRDITEQIEKIENKIKSIDLIKEEHDLSQLNDRLGAFSELESNVMSLKHNNEKELLALKAQEKALKSLGDVPCGDLFPTCKFIKDAHAVKPKIDIQRRKVEASLKKLTAAESALEQMKTENLRDKVLKLQKLHDAHSKYKVEVSQKRALLISLESNGKSLSEKLEEARSRVSSLEEALKNDENVEVIALKSKIDALTNKLSKIDEYKLDLALKKGKLASDIDKYASEHAQRSQILSEMRFSELINSAFSRKGVPSLIVSSQLPIINAEIRKILAGIVDFSVELEVDDSTESMDVYINYGDSKRLIELASGMEKMISSVAIRVALINVSTLPKTDMFIIDEGFGALDDSGIEACNKLLSSLKRYFKTVFVITHVDGVKDAADIILEISKNEKDSRIFYT